ncbi:putative phosphatidate cytidylyltransferase protein [Phaeoacremonium minimum UCRPA7]|uniref:Putative phosphatidate cytidylyltransferase protein n=1 Tax=Phaeoacremonium minimum (strain UCR-PA7) TaxID=1286976 RepID=R8BWD1_PHAM7|nr:putative phosphatidate cytidylyltransferase protein [Phaeoacremonium minimum UCRPA7]EOO03619.1 putative phosphatidate cytidylyltransferase protein [Phaeoacremonium minimum UCRPA7]
MSFRGKPVVPATPRVISPSPTPSERDAASSDENYFGPVTRSAARKRLSTPQPVEEDIDEDEYDASPDLRRARTRSRSPITTRKVNGLTPAKAARSTADQKKNLAPVTNGKVESNGLLSPASAASPGWSWRDFSRSPSPLGLIPIHRHWRTFVHKHEVPRKVLHVSIGFFVIWLYISGTQTSSVAPWLMGALIPIAAVDYARHHYAPFNRFYVKVLGAFMRESEFSGYNGVIFYLLGAWIVLYFFPKDVGVMGVLLLSWCDTAASTFGRLYGRYTPRIRRGKSLAGSLAGFLVGVGTAVWFWGWLAPTIQAPGDDTFMFKGALKLPHTLASAVGLTDAQATISGGLALGVMSIWSGFAAAASEVADVFGWDDNLTIPVLSGLGIWGFLKVFG